MYLNLKRDTSAFNKLTDKTASQFHFKQPLNHSEYVAVLHTAEREHIIYYYIIIKQASSLHLSQYYEQWAATIQRQGNRLGVRLLAQEHTSSTQEVNWHLSRYQSAHLLGPDRDFNQQAKAPGAELLQYPHHCNKVQPSQLFLVCLGQKTSTSHAGSLE